MSFKEQIEDLIAIRKPCIQIRTTLEKEVFPTLINTLYEGGIDSIYRIDEVEKVERVSVTREGKIYKTVVTEDELGTVQFNPMHLLKFVKSTLNNKDERSAFIFLDYDSTFDRPVFRRWIKDIFELRNEEYNPFIFISSEPNLPEDIKHLFSVVYYDNPNQDEILELLNDYETIKNIEIDNKEDLAYKFIGFNKQEIIECLDYSFHKFGEVSTSYIKEKRIEVIKKSNVLGYIEPRIAMNEIGGNNNFKNWYEETKYCFDKEARNYGVAMPKGYLALSAPGCAKSMMAEAIAKDLDVPLITLDMSKLLSKFVGESERNIDQAINTINQLAPCVLLIDEVEKALGGKHINRSYMALY